MNDFIAKRQSFLTKAGPVLFYFLFFVSGITGLIYEVVWGKYLSLFIGNTTYAHTAVLAAFMGGLSLGNYLLGKSADRSRSIIKLYAFLEFGIGIYCLLFLVLVFAFSKVYIGAARLFHLNTVMIYILKFIFSIILIIFPAFLMGGTLPVLTKHLTTRFQIKGRIISSLYFLNSLGAVAGGIIAGFFLIPRFGLVAAEITGVILNCLIGLLALLFYRFQKKGLIGHDSSVDVADIEKLENGETNDRDLPGGEKKWVLHFALIAIGVSGFCSLLYEIVWIRLLSSVIGSSSYSFTIMLATFITGIALGSFLIHKKADAIRKPLILFAILQICLAIVLMLVVFQYEKIPYIFTLMQSLLVKHVKAYGVYQFVKFFICIIIMLIPTTIIGMTLPIITTFCARRFKYLGKDVGRVFSINTIGAVAGAICTGLIFIPLFGTKFTFISGIILNLLLGIVILCFFYKRFIKIILASGAFLLIVSFTLISGIRWNRSIQVGGNYLLDTFLSSFHDYTEYFKKYDLLFFKEDSNTSVAVTEVTLDNKDVVRTLRVNGKPDASSSAADIPTQLLSGHIPMLLHRNPEKIALVGIGSGSTAGTILQYETVNTLDVIEISSAVVTAANNYFQNINHQYYKDPRTRIHVEDAKTFFHTVNTVYNVIISEPSNPWISGIGALYTKEYFTVLKGRLADGGITAQWIQLYNISDETVCLVLHTFQSVFNEVTVWSMTGNDILLVGTKNEHLDPDYDRIDSLLHSKEIQDSLGIINIDSVEFFLARQCLSQKTTVKITASKINSDTRPILEYSAPVEQFLGKNAGLINQLDERVQVWNELLFSLYNGNKPLSEKNLYQIFRYIVINEPDNDKVLSYYFGKAVSSITNPEYFISLIDLLEESENRSAINIMYKKIISLSRDEKYLNKYAVFLLNWAETMSFPFNIEIQAQAVDLFKECLKGNGPKDKYYLNISLSYLKRHDLENAKQYIDMTIEYRKQYAGTPVLADSTLSDEKVYHQAAVVYYNLMKDTADNPDPLKKQTKEFLNTVIRINPGNNSAQKMLSELK